jgi:hypothetical protein
VIAQDDGFGQPEYRPLSRVMNGYAEPLSYVYGRNLSPFANEEEFGTELLEQQEEYLFESLSDEQVAVALKASEQKGQSVEKATKLADTFLEGLYAEGVAIDDSASAEIIKEIGRKHPEVIEGKIDSELLLCLVEDRAVGTERSYIQNNQVALRLHFLIARILADPDSPKASQDFALAMISDRPSFEADMIEWPLQFTKASEEGAEYARQAIQERAHQNEESSRQLLAASELPTKIGAQIDIDGDTMRAVFEHYKGDRRLLLEVFKSLGGDRELFPAERIMLKSKMITGQKDLEPWSADIMKWKGYFDSGTIGKLSELFPSGIPGSLELSAITVIDRHESEIGEFIETINMLSKSEYAHEFAEGGRLYKYADSVLGHVLSKRYTDESKDVLNGVKGLDEAGLFVVEAPGDAEVLINGEFLSALKGNPEQEVEGFRQVMASKLLAQILEGSPSDATKEAIMSDVASHYSTWINAAEGGMLSSVDSELMAILERKVYEDNVPPSSLLEAISQLRMKDESEYDNEILRSLIDRASVDKLPTNPTKLIDRIPDARMRELYVRILELKAGQSGMASSEIYNYLLSNNLMSEDEIAILQDIDLTDRPDLTRLLVEKKDFFEDQRVRSKWLRGEYPDATINFLAAAWASRSEALSEGVADNPYEIIRWVSVKKYMELSKEETELIGGKEFSQLIADHRELAYELARSYPDVRRGIDALRQYFTLEAGGAFHQDEFTPGQVTVEYDGKTYEVEWLPKGSPSFFSMGVDTGCCMTLDGASESCIWRAMTDPNYGGMLVRVDGKVRAQSVGYLGKDEHDENVLVLDNIEVNSGTDESAVREVYKIALEQLMSQGRVNSTVSAVNIGEGFTKVPFGDLAVVAPVAGPQGVYTDAHRQRRLITR